MNEKYYVWQKANPIPVYKKLSVKHDGGSIMVWICFSASWGLGQLAINDHEISMEWDGNHELWIAPENSKENVRVSCLWTEAENGSCSID